MSLTSQSERKSLSRMLSNEENQTVLALGASYEKRLCSLQIEFIGPDYCAEHGAEVQQAVSDFLVEVNAAFGAAGYPKLV